MDRQAAWTVVYELLAGYSRADPGHPVPRLRAPLSGSPAGSPIPPRYRPALTPAVCASAARAGSVLSLIAATNPQQTPVSGLVACLWLRGLRCVCPPAPNIRSPVTRQCPKTGPNTVDTALSDRHGERR